MKNLICLIISFSIFSNIAMADCQWARDIKKVDGGYLYSTECHGRVGILVKDNDDLNTQVVNLRKGLELKDLALKKADENAMLWREQSYDQYNRLQKEIEASHKNDTLHFILGVVVMGAAVYGAGQLR